MSTDRDRMVDAAIRRAAAQSRRETRRASQAQRELEESWLSSGGPAGEGLPSGTFGEVPDLGSPLFSRLRADIGLDDAQSAALWSANMLDDPGFDSILRNGQVNVGTGWTRVGTKWEARKVIVTGDTPTVTARKTTRRRIMAGQIYRSDILVFDTLWSDGETGQTKVELRPTRHTPSSPHIDWPWAVPAARVYVDSGIRAATNLIEDDPGVRMLIYDKEENLLATGDEVDVAELSDDRMEGQPWVGTEDVGNGVWFWLQIDLTKDEADGVGGVAVAVGEPQINYTYQEAPMPYENWSNGGPNATTDQPPAGHWLVDDYERDQPTPTFIVGDEWPAIPTRYVGDMGLNYLADTDIPWTLTSKTNPALTSDVASMVGDPANALNHAHPDNNCSGLAFKIMGWHEKETWYKIVVPAHPGNMAGAQINLRFGGTFGSNPGPLASQQGFRVKVLEAAPTSRRQGVHIGTIPGNGSETTLFIPGHLIPDAGGELWVGIEAAWAADFGDESVYVCSFNWPYNTNVLHSAWAFVLWDGDTFAEWITYSVSPFDMGTILDGATVGAWWVGNNRYHLEGVVGAPIYGITGGAFYVTGDDNEAVGFRVPGSREDDTEAEGPWSSGLGLHEFDISVDVLGLEDEPGIREFHVELISDGITVNGKVHLGDSGHPAGVSIAAPVIEDFKDYDLAVDTKYTVQIDTRDGAEARLKIWPVGSAPPPAPQVTIPIVPSGALGDRTVIWWRVGNGTGPDQTGRLYEWRFGPSTESGGLVRGELLGYGDGVTTTFYTSMQSQPGSGTLLLDGHHVNGATFDPETRAVTPRYVVGLGVKAEADYTAL